MTATAAIAQLSDPSRTTTLVLVFGANGLVVLGGVLVFHKGRAEDEAELAEEMRKLNDGLRPHSTPGPSTSWTLTGRGSSATHCTCVDLQGEGGSAATVCVTRV